MFISKDAEFLNLEKNPRYKPTRNDNNSWLKNVKRFSHNFSTFLFQLPIFFCGKLPEYFIHKKILVIEKNMISMLKARRKSYKISRRWTNKT